LKLPVFQLNDPLGLFPFKKVDFSLLTNIIHWSLLLSNPGTFLLTPENFSEYQLKLI